MHRPSATEHAQRLSTLSARVVEAAVEEYWIHRDAAREHVTKGRQYCQCGICAAVDALIAAREGR